MKIYMFMCIYQWCVGYNGGVDMVEYRDMDRKGVYIRKGDNTYKISVKYILNKFDSNIQ